MSLIITINNIVIPSEDILEYPISVGSIAFENNKILPDEIEIVIDNTDRSTYDDRYPGSLFYGAGFFGDIISVYDDEIGRYIFEGKVKDIRMSESDSTITILADSFLADLTNITCIYTNAADKTVAECIYEILTDVAGIPESNVVYSGFQDAINIQDSNSAYINVSFDTEKKKTCIAVVNELLRISQCHLYTYQNLIYMYQWQPWDGMIGNDLKPRQTLNTSYKHYYSQKEIANSYKIAYDNAGTIAWATGSDAGSIAQFGERLFSVPNENVDKTATVDFRVNFRNSTGAEWAGDLAIERYSNLQKYCEFVMSADMEFVRIAEQLDLRFAPFIGEPVQIVERAFDKEKNQIEVKAIFLNTPEQRYDRDAEPPAAPQLIDVIPLSDGGVVLKWTKSTEADWLGYKIYLTASKGEWWTETCNWGRSPVDRKVTQTTPDGYVYEYVYQLSVGNEYSFYVTSYDTSYNESDPSNIATVRIYLDLVDIQLYRCTGNIVIGLSPDQTNPWGGTNPLTASEAALFGTALYGVGTYSPAAVFQSSQRCDTVDGFTKFSFRGQGDPLDITYQFRTSDDDVTYTAWTIPADAIGNVELSLSGPEWFQFRFLFNPSSWNDTDTIYVKELE